MNAEGANREKERAVPVSRSDDGTMGGAMVWLSLDDLDKLGVDPDAEEVSYAVRDGQLTVRSGGAVDG